MSVTNSKDFQYSLKCLDCVYSDLGYNGTKDCMPKTKSCKPLNSYDMSMQSRLRDEDIFTPEGMSKNTRGRNIANKAVLKRKD